MGDIVLAIIIIVIWRVLVRAHRRGLDRKARYADQVRWAKHTVTPMPPPWDDTPPVTLARALQCVPSSVAQDFCSVHGSHRWIETSVVDDVCTYCSDHQRHKEAI
jgi:hypothetical protein